jgi:hypothetical protein
MSRIMLIVQEKGGVGKSTLARALAEAVPDAPLIELDSSPRLLEYGDRVTFFPMRAERAEIERTGGRAARKEFDGVINSLCEASLPTIVDVGANTSAALLAVLCDLADDLKGAGVEIGVLVIVTAEPGALAEAPRLLGLAKPWAGALFVIENRMRGSVDPRTLKAFGDVPIIPFNEQVLEDAAVGLLQAGGLASVPKLDRARLTERFGLSLGARIRRDLTRFRAEAMDSVRQPAAWLVG